MHLAIRVLVSLKHTAAFHCKPDPVVSPEPRGSRLSGSGIRLVLKVQGGGRVGPLGLWAEGTGFPQERFVRLLFSLCVCARAQANSCMFL